MKKKIIPFGLVILGLIITSCGTPTNQEFSFNSESRNSEESIDSITNHDSSQLSYESLSSKQSNSSMFDELSSLEQPHTRLKPVSDEMLSNYAASVALGGNAMPENYRTTINSLYEYYKSGDSEHMAKIVDCSEEVSFVGEDVYRCYYVTKEVIDAVNKRMTYPSAVPESIVWTRLTAYFYMYGSKSDVILNNTLMETEIDCNSNCVDAIVDDYYLLDVVRIYNVSNTSSNRLFVDLIKYESSDQQMVTFKKNKEKHLKYRYCLLDRPRPFVFNEKYELNLISYMSYIDYSSFKIEFDMENSLEIVNQSFTYENQTDPHYYDEIEECIVKKVFIRTYYSYNIYDVVFDYNKIINMLELHNKDEETI